MLDNIAMTDACVAPWESSEGFMRKIALTLLIAFGLTIVAASLFPSHVLVQTAVAGPKDDR